MSMFFHRLVKGHSDHVHHLQCHATVLISYLVLIIIFQVNSTRGELFYVLPLHTPESCPQQQLPWSNFSDLATATISQANYTDIDILILPSSNLPYVRNVSLDSIVSLPVQVCFCDEQKRPDCGHNLPSIHVKKGERFTISLAAVDQAGQPVEAAITSSLLNEGTFDQGQQTQNVQGACTDLSFNVASPSDNEVLELFAEGPCGDFDLSVRQVKITFNNCTCPVGFQPSNNDTTCTCECESSLNDYIIGCNESTSSIIKQGVNVWIAYVNESSLTNGLVIEPNCPFDYCRPPTERVSINLNLPNGADAQCAFNRTGLLCGACIENFSVSLGSSECVVCDGNWPLVCFGIILASAIAGVLLVSTLLALNITVADGQINVFIFYANGVGASMNSYFSFSESRFPTVFTSWINLDIGFNVCFIDGLNTYWKTWLQLAFPTYIISLVLLVIVVSEYSPRFAKLIGKRDPVATLATLILLSYTKLLSICLLVFSYDTLEYPNHNYFTVWLPDGNVRYYEGRRIIFLMVAYVVIFFGFVYTILLFSWQWLIRAPRWKILRWTKNTKFNAFIATYHAPYNSQYRFWTGLLLFIRVVLYITTAFTGSDIPQVPLLMTICLLGSIIFLKEIIGIRIYKNVATDIIEIIMYFNLVMFAVFSLSDLRGNIVAKRVATSYASTLLALILLLGIMITHVVDLTGYRYSNLINFWKKKTEARPPVSNEPAQTSESEHVTYSEITLTDVTYS